MRNNMCYGASPLIDSSAMQTAPFIPWRWSKCKWTKPQQSKETEPLTSAPTLTTCAFTHARSHDSVCVPREPAKLHACMLKVNWHCQLSNYKLCLPSANLHKSGLPTTVSREVVWFNLLYTTHDMIMNWSWWRSSLFPRTNWLPIHIYSSTCRLLLFIATQLLLFWSNIFPVLHRSGPGTGNVFLCINGLQNICRSVCGLGMFVALH